MYIRIRMRRNEDVLTPGELTSFLGINLQRLRIWLQAGLFGDEQRTPGRGHPRSFSRRDAIIARVILEVMNLTRARSLALAKESLFKEVNRVLAKWLPHVDKIFYSATGAGPEKNPTYWLIISWDREKNDWHLTSALGGGGSGYPLREINDGHPGVHSSVERLPGEAVILVPVWEMIAEVDRFLEKRGAKA